MMLTELAERKQYWLQLRIVGISLVGSPVILLLIAHLLGQRGLQPLIPSYEEGMARILQYVLFGVGVAIFFFCDGISHFLAGKLFHVGKSAVLSKQEAGELLAGYTTYTVVMMAFMDTIGIMGFIGFLICGNLTWLVVFVLLSLSIAWKYLPSPARLSGVLAQLQK